jgi:regulator of protease activity HflC (stomatin/prohibitin superfamily)
MVDEATGSPAEREGGQLTQARVPLDAAADAFTHRDESGRLPIIVMPERFSRVRLDLALAAGGVLAAGILLQTFFGNPLFSALATLVAVALLAVAARSLVMLRVPEGANALLLQRGRYWRTIGAGVHMVPPWIGVSHLVTRREIPFDVPIAEVPTSDDVRASVDILATFTITDPYRFVYSISADDFDQVFQAVCQDALRTHVRRLRAEEVIDLARGDTAALRETIGAEVEAYGVALNRVTVTYAQPQAEFMRTQESRQLAATRRAEQAEQQALAQRRQADAEALLRQRVLAEAEAEGLRLAKLEERLRASPLAAQYDLERARLEVARALAGNARALLQVGAADDIARALLLRGLLPDQPAPAGQEDAAEGGRGEPAG